MEESGMLFPHKDLHLEQGDEGFFERNICEVFVLQLPEGPDILSLPLLLHQLLVSSYAAFKYIFR